MKYSNIPVLLPKQIVYRGREFGFMSMCLGWSIVVGQLGWWEGAGRGGGLYFFCG